MSSIIDLRSDTITLPTAGMRRAMAEAVVGDDQFGEDPTINSLQERVAALLGKEAALWLPSGTMANQVALRTLTRPGDDVIVSRESHAVWHETGASAANAGVQFTEIGQAGQFTREQFLAAVKVRGHIIYPPTTLLEIENTHNRAGGIIFDQKEVVNICASAREREVATFLDGARLWNVSAASRLPLSSLAAPFDLVSVAFSKGLGAPGGSMLAGSRDLIGRATRYRRMAGGAMRQVGIFAAACHYALDHHLERLRDDHVHALCIAEMLVASARIRLDVKTVQTNIIVFGLGDGAPDAATVVQQAKDRGVLLFAFGARTVRAVTHMDVTKPQCERAAEILLEIIDA
jgi:threonine aldolase